MKHRPNIALLQSPYPWIPQSYIIVCAKGEHTRLDIPVCGGWMPVSPDTDVAGCDGHHEDYELRQWRPGSCVSRADLELIGVGEDQLEKSRSWG